MAENVRIETKMELPPVSMAQEHLSTSASPRLSPRRDDFVRDLDIHPKSKDKSLENPCLTRVESKDRIAEMLQLDIQEPFITQPNFEPQITSTEAEPQEAGVSAATWCRIRHATFGTEWGQKGGLKLVSGGEPLVRWQFGSVRRGFPIMFMFAVETPRGRKYVTCDRSKQKIRLLPERKFPDPASVDVDSDTSDPRLFVFNMPVGLGGSSGFLHPSYTWKNPSEVLLSVNEEDEQIVLSVHDLRADTWLLDEA